MTRLSLHGLEGSALLLLVLPALLVAGGGVGCGPSFQAVYEGELHFEHCYALDEMSVTNDSRKECWRDWLRGYTYGQSNDRVEYAATRFSELSLDESLPSQDVNDGGVRPAHHHRTEATVAAPVPTNAFAPPPSMGATDVRDPAPIATADPPKASHPKASDGPVMPGAECASACQDRWDSCKIACKDGACAACDKGYRGCMPACFREDAGTTHAH